MVYLSSAQQLACSSNTYVTLYQCEPSNIYQLCQSNIIKLRNCSLCGYRDMEYIPREGTKWVARGQERLKTLELCV